jgi:hypothetical protein
MTLETIPSPSTASVPEATTVAPTTPPISACEDEDGSPKPPGPEVPGDRADQAAEHHARRDHVALDDALGDGRRHLQRDERADEVEDRGDRDRELGLERAGGDRRRHRVGGVVEAVGEVEAQGGDDDQGDDDVCRVHGQSRYEGPGNRQPPRSPLFHIRALS